MSVGLGIFLGCVYLGTVYLYTQTRDRWNWSRIILSCGIAAVFAGALLGGMALYQKWRPDEHGIASVGVPSGKPEAVTSIGDVALGDAWSDVVFRVGGDFKGEPSPDQGRYPGTIIYTHDKLPLVAHVYQGRVTYIVYRCPREGPSITVNGIACGDSGDRIMERFAKQIRVLCLVKPSSISSSMRAYDAVDFGTRYVLSSNKVTAFAVADKAEMPYLSGINWGKCELMPVEPKSVETVQPKTAGN